MIKFGVTVEMNFDITQRREDESQRERFDSVLAQITSQATSILVTIADELMEQERKAADHRKAAMLDSNQIGATWNNRGTIQ